MQASQRIGREIRRECDPKAVISFLKCFSSRIERILEDKFMIKCIKKDDRVLISVYSPKTMKHILEKLDEAYLYWAGIQIAMLHEDKVIPALGALSLLELAGIERNFVVVNERGEKLFLYGRDLFKNSIKEAHLENLSCTRGIVIVLNEEMIGLGWGRVKNPRFNRRTKKVIEFDYIENLIDLGWYLRSGV
ncbi:MAG: hypothetical protein ABWW69_07590 [Pyrodictiaceae archaeon]